MHSPHILIMAAGLGTRMKSRRAKVLHQLAGRSLLGHVCHTAIDLSPAQLILIVGHQAEAVEAKIRQELQQFAPDIEQKTKLEFVLQTEQRGTGHAVQMAEAVLSGQNGTVLVLSGDVPLVRPGTLRRLLEVHTENNFAATVLTTDIPDPTGYGRILREADGTFSRIVEHRDATPQQRTIPEINSGIYAFEINLLLPALARLSPANAQGEYYLTDVLGLLKSDGHRVGIVLHSPPEEVLGINSRIELAETGARLRQETLRHLMRRGVTIVDPASTFIDADAQIGMDTVIYPNVTIEGPTIIGEECVINPGARLVNARLGNRVTVRDYSLVFDSTLEDNTSVGPFAHLRMGAHMASNAVVGNFVEVKKSTLGPGSKAMHLTYLGDATIGSKVNIGAGTVTCNYDGKNKHATIIEDGVKIGSDTMLVAPVRVGKNSVTGAGSVVTRDIPDHSLAAGVPATVKKTFPSDPLAGEHSQTKD
ncbi:MAG: bifunctional UDP-N-acetylglucosamine diphosphorylase/glucosamine-1-phosphate N-acetyltransferase GlmU [Acidobacteria bacterium]|nr:bifunctional UDP-N-acetylglucosamine diphosphorylase/glucosamine-1-phosphate N-acetyltransferase GlmU [Acidobacteriota bacterium]